MNEFKVKMTDDGKIIMNVYDLIASLDDEEREELAEYFAYQSTMFREIKNHILNEWAGPDWNEEIHKIRVEFLTGEDADRRVAAMVTQLLIHLRQAEKQVALWDKTYWDMYHTWNKMFNDNYGVRNPFPIARLAHVSLEFPKGSEVKEYINAQTKDKSTSDS